MTSALGRNGVVLLLSMALTGTAAAAFDVAPAVVPVQTLEEGLARLWGPRVAPVPPDLAHLIWEMAVDPAVEEEGLARADASLRPLTRRLLTTLTWTEPEAVQVLPDLYVVQMGGPPPGERPPTWADVRWVGLRLLRRIAGPPTTGRDHRLQRDLDQAVAAMTRRTPSEVGGLVVLWQEWWADRGADASFYLDPDLVPTVDAWLKELDAVPGLAGETTSLLEMVRRLVDDPLRRTLLLERLDPAEHAHLVAEAIEILRLYRQDLEERGIPSREWDPERGRQVGYHPSDLREVALEILDRVTPRMAEGVDEDSLILDWLDWWQRARFQARYHRDPLRSPTLEPWLAGLDRSEDEGGRTVASFLRELFLAAPFRDLVLEQMGPAQRGLVAELIEWLGKDQSAAVASGFQIAYRRLPLRPQPDDEGLMMAIPWYQVHDLIRELLYVLTGELGLGDREGPAAWLDASWQDWWRMHRDDPQWYRGDARPEGHGPRRFVPERARAG